MLRGSGAAHMQEEIPRQDLAAPTGEHAQAAGVPVDFIRLVKLVGRAFYDDVGFNGDELTCSCSNNHGIAVVVLDQLTCHQWVIEKDLSNTLNIGKRKMTKILQFFEEEKFLKRKKLKPSSQADIGRAAPTQTDVVLDEQIRRRCCCLDYPQIYDITSYKLKKMKEKLKFQLDSRNTPPQYICQNCLKRYSAFDIMELPIDEDDNVQCNICYKVVAAVGVEKSTELVARMKRFEEQLKPLILHLELMKNKPLPDFGYVHEGEGINSGALRPVLGEAAAVLLHSFDQEEKHDTNSTELKIIPEWLIREGMLSEEHANRAPEAHAARKVGGKSKRCEPACDLCRAGSLAGRFGLGLSDLQGEPQPNLVELSQASSLELYVHPQAGVCSHGRVLRQGRRQEEASKRRMAGHMRVSAAPKSSGSNFGGEPTGTGVQLQSL